MLDILDDYLTSTATPEQHETVRDAISLFERVNDPDYENAYNQFLMLDGEADAGVTLESILDYTRKHCFDILALQGVTLDEDTYLSRLNLWLRAVLDLPDYEDMARIAEICSGDSCAEDLFSDLMALVTGLPADTLLIDIASIDAALLPRLVSQASQQHAYILTQEELVIKQARRTEYLAFLQFNKIQQLKLAHFLARGLDVGYPVMLYWNLLSKEFNQMEPLAIALEMVAAAYLSEDGHINPRQMIQSHLEHFLTDPEKITKVDIFASDLILKFTSHAKL